MNREATKLMKREAFVEIDGLNDQGAYSEWLGCGTKEEDLKGKRILYLWFSDNVLDEENWTIASVQIDPETGCFESVRIIHQGVYSVPFYKNFKELLAAVNHDPTGAHPETYTEVRTWEYMGEAHMVQQPVVRRKIPAEDRY